VAALTVQMTKLTQKWKMEKAGIECRADREAGSAIDIGAGLPGETEYATSTDDSGKKLESALNLARTRKTSRAITSGR